jgi:putative nucleotidyltransferase with HDIG domain
VIGHLARRWAGSLSKEVPDPAPAAAVLTPAELALWLRFGAADQRHALAVAARLVAAHPDASRDEVAAALLHDIGKIDTGLGTGGRVLATVWAVGERAHRYRDHERLGAAMLRSVASNADVVSVVAGEPSPARERVEAADDV